MNENSYEVNQRVLESLSTEELKRLLAVRSIDLGWWTRFYGIELMSEDEIQQIVNKSDSELENDWMRELPPLKMVDLLAEYADGYYRGARNLLSAIT
jgi:hypothetical protein